MTKLGDEKMQVPVLMIQCDWDDVLFTLNKQVWVSCKYRGAPSSQGQLKSRAPDTPTSLSEDFDVVSCSKDSIHVVHRESNHSCVFLPPTNQWSIHNKAVLSVDVSQGGLGVSVCQDKLHVWDSGTGNVRRVLTGHLGDIYKAMLFPSGIVVLSAGTDMKLKIWSAETGQCPVTLVGHKAAVTDMAIIDRGRNIVSVSKDGNARLWDCGQASCIATLLNTSLVLNCCTVGKIHTSFTVDRRDLQNDREVGTEDKIMYIGTEDGQVLGLALCSRKVVFTINIKSAVNIVLCLSDLLLVAGCQDGSIIVYNCADVAEPVNMFHESNSPVLSGCIYGQGVFIGHHDGMVVYYNCFKPSNSRIQLTGSDCDPIYGITCSKDTVYTACRDGKIRKYNVNKCLE